ncbi:MnhB domain-containing protein [Candidatus Margulisiibacteriota bacterium]
MTIIVKTIVKLVGGLVVLFGIYLVLHGHLSPGGGFAGGVILASGFVLITLAFGRESALKRLSERAASMFESVGALVFLGVALLGYAGGYFFLNLIPKGEPFKLFSAGMIPISNIGIGIKVGAALFAGFIALVAMKINGKGK